MIYKRYEFSLSLYGTKVMHIARNALGVVVFRADSEKELKDKIDEYLYQEAQARAAEARKRAERAKAKKKGLLFKEEEEKSDEDDGAEVEGEDTPEEGEKEESESVLVPSTPLQTSVTRGPDGKFISKSALEKEEPEKKSFWDKLK